MTRTLSLIIPAHNAIQTIDSLLVSIVHSKKTPSFEVIIVDDASTDDTVNAIRHFVAGRWLSLRSQGEKPLIVHVQHVRMHDEKKKKSQRGGFPLTIVQLKANHGPAYARNRGAGVARGNILLFLDSDVELFSDTLSRVGKAFEDLDLHALTGVWDKKQKTKKFFPRFKALRDWSYWIHERDQRGYYYLFSTRVAAIRRDLFHRLGGFDERYASASVEDIEFTYRVARRYAVIFDPKVRVRHEFEDFWPVAKKYFLRSREWSALYATRGKFDPVAATRAEAITALSAVGIIGSFVLWLGVSAVWGIGEQFKVAQVWRMGLPELEVFLASCFLFFVSLHLFGVRKFLAFTYGEEGLGFSVKSFFMGLVLYLVIFAGAISFAFSRLRKTLQALFR